MKWITTGKIFLAGASCAIGSQIASMTEATQKPVRQGQAHKRAAILAAARELFVQAGVGRTSMDAIAARAEVSKRTVYDYYGDKRRLLLGVIEDAGEAALDTLRRLIEQHPSDAVAVIDAAELERVVTDFAADLGSSLLVSSNYAAAIKLIAENEPLLPELEDHPLDEAADHFHALTTLRVLNEPLRRRAEAEHVRQIMTDGAHAFMRAYASRSNSRG